MMISRKVYARAGIPLICLEGLYFVARERQASAVPVTRTTERVAVQVINRTWGAAAVRVTCPDGTSEVFVQSDCP
jgi:hypothetical protein